MRCEVITVGTEILLGDTVNTNAAWISRRLAQYGVNLFQQRTVGDNHGRLVALLQESMRENDIIVTTGGLGPTQDDITRECVAEALGVPLVLAEFSLKRIQSFFELRGRTMTENNRRQAMIPRGGTALLNDAGTAPGCLITVGTTTVIMLP
ncbi:MAG: competence/damage-inducible protein A, partial [Spirochaetota bacterium]